MKFVPIAEPRLILYAIKHNAMKYHIKDYLKLIRPQHWIKNFFVMIPLFFGGELFDSTALLCGAIVFVAFSLVASSIYCYNDIVDADDDRRHPVKCHRPVASGKVSAAHAYALMAVLFVAAVAVLLLLPPTVMPSAMAVVTFYYILNLAYCSRLKQYAILDVCIVAFGFVLRYVEPHHLGYWPTFAVTVAVTMPLAWLLHKASSAVSDRLLAVAMRHSGDGTLPHGRDNVSAKDN